MARAPLHVGDISRRVPAPRRNRAAVICRRPLNHARQAPRCRRAVENLDFIVHRLPGPEPRVDPPVHGNGMTYALDTDSLRRTAGHIDGHAEQIRIHAGRLLTAAEQAAWRSPAAEVFREQVRELAVRMTDAACRVENASDALRRYAIRVDAAQQSIAGFVGGVWNGSVSVGRRMLRGGASVIGEGLEAIGR